MLQYRRIWRLLLTQCDYFDKPNLSVGYECHRILCPHYARGRRAGPPCILRDLLNGRRGMVAAGLVGVYIHLNRANLPQLPYLQLVFIPWGAELFCRLMRIL